MKQDNVRFSLRGVAPFLFPTRTFFLCKYAIVSMQSRNALKNEIYNTHRKLGVKRACLWVCIHSREHYIFETLKKNRNLEHGQRLYRYKCLFFFFAYYSLRLSTTIQPCLQYSRSTQAEKFKKLFVPTLYIPKSDCVCALRGRASDWARINTWHSGF